MEEVIDKVKKRFIEPYHNAIFCTSLQTITEGLNYETIRATYTQNKSKLLNKKLDDNQRRLFATTFTDQYCGIHSDFFHKDDLFRSVLYLISPGECKLNPFPYNEWFNDENRSLLRAVIQIGTKSIEEIKKQYLPFRTVSQIRTKWGYWFRKSFKCVLIKENTRISAEISPEISSDAEDNPQETDVTEEVVKEYNEENIEDDIAKDFDPKIYYKLTHIAKTMTYRTALKLCEREDISSLQLVQAVFDICFSTPTLTTQLVSVLRCYNEHTKTPFDQEDVMSTFVPIADLNQNWKTLEEFIYQSVVSGDFVEIEIERIGLVPPYGFRVDPFNDFVPFFKPKKCIEARKALEEGKRKIRVCNNTDRLQSGHVIEKKEWSYEKEEDTDNKVIQFLEEAISHKKGISYSEEARIFFKLLYIIKPENIRCLHQFGVAPDESTVYNWVNGETKEYIHLVKEVSDVIKVIHLVTDEATKDISGPIFANIAGDGVYMAEHQGPNDSPKKLQYFVYQLQPLDKRIPCVALNFATIGKMNCQMVSKDIPDRFAEIADAINNDKTNKFVVVYFSTDADNSTDCLHRAFFEKYLAGLSDDIELKELAAKWEWQEIIPISDFLHLLKTARAHLLNHLMKLSRDRKTLNIEKIKEVLKIGDALANVSHWAKMCDSYAIALFQITSFMKVMIEIGDDESVYMAPFTLMNEAIRSTCLSKGDRINMLQAAFNILKWIQNCTKDSSKRAKEDQEKFEKDFIPEHSREYWLPKFEAKATGTLFGTEIFIIRIMNLCFGLITAIIKLDNVPLDRIGTHALENYFGFIRIASKNDHTPSMMLTHCARAVIMKQCFIELNCEYKIRKRENVGGVEISQEMEIFQYVSNINPKVLSDKIISNTLRIDKDIMNRLNDYVIKITTPSSHYPKIYRSSMFAGKQPSARIKGDKAKKELKTPPINEWVMNEQPLMMGKAEKNYKKERKIRRGHILVAVKGWGAKDEPLPKGFENCDSQTIPMCTPPRVKWENANKKTFGGFVSSI